MKILPVIAIIACVISTSYGYFIGIDAHAEECFFERATAGQKLGLAFEVIEGGFLDIDIRILDPTGNTIYEDQRQSTNRYFFSASSDGMYTYCFSNKMSTMTPKTLMFTMEVVDKDAEHKADGDDKEEDGGDHKLEGMIKQLSAALAGVKHEQDYMEVRERVHRSINENTNSRVVLWAVFEALVLLSMSAGQVYYLKQFFEVRRVV